MKKVTKTEFVLTESRYKIDEKDSKKIFEMNTSYPTKELAKDAQRRIIESIPDPNHNINVGITITKIETVEEFISSFVLFGDRGIG